MRSITAMCHFWKWFLKNEATYIGFLEKHQDKELEYLFQELQVHARSCSQWLGVDILPAGESKGELIITANGRWQGFKKAERLAAKAPPLEHWTVTALRQPNPVGSFIKRMDADIDIDLSKMWFQPCGMESRGRRGINVFVEYILPGQERAVHEFVWNVLENLVGERCLGLDIAVMEIDAKCNASADKPLRALEALPAFCDKIRPRMTIGAGGKITGF